MIRKNMRRRRGAWTCSAHAQLGRHPASILNVQKQQKQRQHQRRTHVEGEAVEVAKDEPRTSVTIRQELGYAFAQEVEHHVSRPGLKGQKGEEELEKEADYHGMPVYL